MTILSRMIGDLPSDGFLAVAGPRAAAGLRTGGALLSRFTRFAMPGSYRRMLAERVLFLVMLAGLALVLISFAAGPGLGRAGWTVFLAALALWLVLYALGRWLSGRKTLPQLARLLLIVIALALMAIGGVTVANHLFP